MLQQRVVFVVVVLCFSVSFSRDFIRPNESKIEAFCAPKDTPNTKSILPGFCSRRKGNCGNGVYTDSPDCQPGEECCKPNPLEDARFRKFGESCGNNGRCHVDCGWAHPFPFPACDKGLCCMFVGNYQGPAIGDRCGEGKGWCVDNPRVNCKVPLAAGKCSKGTCCEELSFAMNFYGSVDNAVRMLPRTDYYLLTDPSDRDTKRVMTAYEEVQAELNAAKPGNLGADCKVYDQAMVLRKGKCLAVTGDNLASQKANPKTGTLNNYWENLDIARMNFQILGSNPRKSKLKGNSDPRLCANPSKVNCYYTIPYSDVEQDKMDKLNEYIEQSIKTYMKIPLSSDADTFYAWFKNRLASGASWGEDICRSVPLSLSLTEEAKSAKLAERLETFKNEFRNPISRKLFVDTVVKQIQDLQWLVYSISPPHLCSTTLLEMPDFKPPPSLSDFNKVPVSSDPAELKNFFYGHRSYAGYAPFIARNDKEWQKYVAMNESFQRDLYARYGEKKDFADRVLAYFGQIDTKKRPQTNDELKEFTAMMEGHPYMAAWALDYISKHNVKSNAENPMSSTTMLQQPLEIDVYFPADLGDRIASGQKIDWADLLDNEVKIGHGKAFAMITEALMSYFDSGCRVTNLPGMGITKFIELGTWFRLVNVLLRYIQGEVHENSLTSSLFQLAVRDAQVFPRMLGIDFKVVLDIKCRFPPNTPMEDLVQTINTRYGVVVTGLGSFYKLPTLNVVPQAVTTTTNKPPASFMWFFSPENFKEGMRVKHVLPGANVGLTASAFIEDVTEGNGAMDTGNALTTPCKYRVNIAGLVTLREAKVSGGYKFMLWSQEKEITRAAAYVLFDMVNKERDLFPLGFALGGPHNPAEWPYVGKCGDIGGMRSWGLIANK